MKIALLDRKLATIMFVFSCDEILQKRIFVFLPLEYRQSMEQKIICALNFFDRPKILENAKISCSTVLEINGNTTLNQRFTSCHHEL